MSRWKLVFLSLFAVVAMSAVASASASALEFYNSSGKLIEGLLPIVSLGGLQRLEGEVAGVKLEIHCKHVHNFGSIHNGIGAGGILMGLGWVILIYLECTIHSPKPKTVEGCVVPGGQIETAELSELAITQSSKPYIEFAPKTGTDFVTIPFEGCKNTGLNGGHEVTGLARAEVNNATSEVIAKTGAGELDFAGIEARYAGSAVVEMEGGGAITVE
jgi:hypothetical protein